MRHPRARKNRTTRWMVRASARPTSFEIDHENGIWHVGVDPKHFAPWTPARARSQHWIDAPGVRL